VATKVNSFADLQAAVAKWMRKPGETEEQYRDRINNDPSNEISLNLFAVPEMIREQEEENRFEAAKPVEKKDDSAT
jgi:hypothetical protein